MECSNCGIKNEEDSKFCIKCGLSLDKNIKRNVEDVLFVPKKQPSHTLRNIGLVTLVVIVLLFIIGIFADSANNTTTTSNSTSLTDSNTGWQTFNSIEHKFQIDFPKYPTTERIPEDKSSGFTYSGTQYSAEDENSNTFFTQAADYSISPNEYDNKTGLEGMINYMFKSNQYKLTESTFTKFRGFDAINFSFSYTDKSQTYYGKGIAFIQDNLSNIKAFILMVFGNSNLIPNYDKFINSFKLTN